MQRAALIALAGFLATTAQAGAQSLQFYLSKASMDCIVANQEAYIAAKTYDFAVIFPKDCPNVPADVTISNEYLKLPDTPGAAPEEPQAILVPVAQFACLSQLAGQTAEVPDEALLLVNLETCAVSP